MFGKSKKDSSSKDHGLSRAILEGILSRKNRYGEWKERYCYLVGDLHFISFRPDKQGKATTEIKEQYEIFNIISADMIAGDTLQLSLKGGEKSLFKGDRVRRWYETFFNVIEEYRENFKPRSSSIGLSGKDRDSLGSNPMMNTSSGNVLETAAAEAAALPVEAAIAQTAVANAAPSSPLSAPLFPSHLQQISKLEGILKRKNRHGEWKERYCYFDPAYTDNTATAIAAASDSSNGPVISTTGPRFLAYRVDKASRGPSEEVKEVYNLRDIAELTVIKSKKSGRDLLQITLRYGESSLLKGDAILAWHTAFLRAVKQSMEEYLARLQIAALHPTDPQAQAILRGLHLAGYLQKKSHNKYQGFQERFVKIEGLALKYYKKMEDAATVAANNAGEAATLASSSLPALPVANTEEALCLGSVPLLNIDFVRPYDDSNDCRIFEVKEEDRVYCFMAASNDEMLQYVHVLNTLHGIALDRLANEAQRKLEEETPQRIRFYDGSGEAAFKAEIMLDLIELYPEKTEEQVAEESATLARASKEGQGQAADKKQKMAASAKEGEEDDNEDEEGDDEDEEEDSGSLDEDERPALYTVKQHLACAQALVRYLQDFYQEVVGAAAALAAQQEQQAAQAANSGNSKLRGAAAGAAAAGKGARYDILAVVMTMINELLQQRFFSFLPPLSCDGEEASPARQSNSSQGEATEQQSSGGKLSLALEEANLGDIHALIDWITKYQLTLKQMRCPVAAAAGATSTAGANGARLSSTHLSPKACQLFDPSIMYRLCSLYVHGGSTGTKGGAAYHLFDYVRKVWQSVEAHPEEMLQRHNNGTFYTHAPIDMWEAINQHLSLAIQTKQPILHVMIAEKVVKSLLQIFAEIIAYIQGLDTSQTPALKEIELEYLSALANDTALHIEEVVNLIEAFAIQEIRDRIDDIFDPLTTDLVRCGNACLSRLASLVMSDVQALLEEVFTEAWMEGNQMHVATATISDYMKDFETYLVAFWADKFVMTILEEVIVAYTRCLLYRKNYQTAAEQQQQRTQQLANQAAASAGNGSEQQPAKMSSMFSSFFSKTKQAVKQTTQQLISSVSSAPSSPYMVPVDPESLGRLAQDVNILNAFFSLKAGQEIASDILSLINEVSLMLFVDLHGLIQHVCLRVTEYPNAALAIQDIAAQTMKMRYHSSDGREFSKDQQEYFYRQLQPVLDSAPQEAQLKEQNMQQAVVSSGRLGLLYIDVPPKKRWEELTAASTKATIAADSTKGGGLAQRMKMMANIPLFGNKARRISSGLILVGKGGSGKIIEGEFNVDMEDDEDDDDDEEEEEDDEEDGDKEENDSDGDEANNNSNNNKSASNLNNNNNNNNSSQSNLKAAIAAGAGGGGQLINEVMEVLQQQATYDQEEDRRYAEQQARKEQALARRQQLLISYNGYLEKKSPAHNLWQRRYFKLITREQQQGEGSSYHSTLLWYKKEGGTASKTLEVDKIEHIALLHSSRALAYLPPPRQLLVLQSEAKQQGQQLLQQILSPVLVQDYPHEENNYNKDNDSNNNEANLHESQHVYSFLIVTQDGKEHILRGSKVDRVMKWINCLALAAGLAYDSQQKVWNRIALDYYKVLEQEKRSLISYQQVAAPSALPSNNDRKLVGGGGAGSGGTGRAMSSESLASTSSMAEGEQEQHQQGEIDSRVALQLIQAAKKAQQQQQQEAEQPSPSSLTKLARSDSNLSQVSTNSNLDDTGSGSLSRQEKLRREREIIRQRLDEEEQRDQQLASKSQQQQQSMVNPIRNSPLVSARKSMSSASSSPSSSSPKKPVIVPVPAAAGSTENPLRSASKSVDFAASIVAAPEEVEEADKKLAATSTTIATKDRSSTVSTSEGSSDDPATATAALPPTAPIATSSPLPASSSSASRKNLKRIMQLKNKNKQQPQQPTKTTEGAAGKAEEGGEEED